MDNVKKRRPYIAGDKYNGWTLLECDLDKSKECGRAYWLCMCDCGKEKVICASNIKSGKTKSCGCKSSQRG